MRKKLFTPLLLLLIAHGLCAQNNIVVQYKQIENEQILDITRFQKIEYFEIVLTGNFKGKKCVLKENICKQNEVLSKEHPSLWAAPKDTMRFTVISQNLDTTSVRISINSREGIFVDKKYTLSNISNHILMETFVKEKELRNDTAPIVAFTTGISEKFNINGEEVLGLDFCGLRNSKTHPKRWKEKHKLSEYIYYEVVIVP